MHCAGFPEGVKFRWRPTIQRVTRFHPVPLCLSIGVFPLRDTILVLGTLTKQSWVCGVLSGSLNFNGCKYFKVQPFLPTTKWIDYCVDVYKQYLQKQCNGLRHQVFIVYFRSSLQVKRQTTINDRLTSWYLTRSGCRFTVWWAHLRPVIFTISMDIRLLVI